MTALKLIDLIRLTNLELGKFKIHLATAGSAANSPLTAFFNGRFKEWQEYQTRRNFQCDSVLALIHVQSDKWLFAGAWQVLGVEARADERESWFQYSTAELSGLEHLVGRVVVEFARSFRASYLHAADYIDQLLVAEILPARMSMDDFPGYSAVLLSFDQLQHVVSNDLPTWRAALSSVSGIYLINDTSCGRLYVGSACGVDGVWGRWSCYVATLHGGNVELRELLEEKGPDHVKHFQFAILEICDIREPQDAVLERESHWKKALHSRIVGYNSN